MEEANESRQALLAAIGLKEIMTERNYCDPFNKDHFHRYTSQEYLQSANREMDEVYRMGEVVLMHKQTGLRVGYLTTETYYGDELRYRVMDVFVITKGGRSVGVTGIDFNKQMFDTPNGAIPFDEVKLDP